MSTFPLRDWLGDRRSHGLLGTALLVCAVWFVIQVLHFDRFIVHDSWQHIFPFIYRLARSSSCGEIAGWLGTIDNGSPASIYALSFSLTHLPRLLVLNLLSCMDLPPQSAVYLQKLQILGSWLLLSLGMYALGRGLFTHRASAVYLFAATLFSGACLQASHSDQVVSELFWVPWITLSFAIWHRKINQGDAARYFNLGVLFFSLSLLDHYPHLVASGAALAGAIYVLLHTASVFDFVRRAWRQLWPSLLLIALVGAQLSFLKGAIADYSPSLRADLIVDPAKFGTTGFVQPTAIVSLFFPLGFLADYDALFTTLPQYIFKLDLLMFGFGMFPLLFAVAAALSRRVTRAAKIGWFAFLLAILAVSLQQTRLYHVLFHLPFFDVFRGYFLFSMLTVFALWVISGYGFDALASATPEERRRLLRNCLAWLGGSLILVALLFLWLAHHVPSPLQTLRRISIPLCVDLAVLAGGGWFVWQAAAAPEADSWGRRIVIGLAVLQLPLFIGAYRMLSVPSGRMFDRYALESADRMPHPAASNSTGVNRKLCTTYAQCYLSTHRTVSLNTDLEGTFLRHRDEPVFQVGLSRAAQEALSALSRQDAWLSRRLTHAQDKSEIMAALNSAPDVGALLAAQTFSTVREASGSPPPAAHEGSIVKIQRGPDRIAVTYRAPDPQILTLAVNFDRGWQASIRGREVPLLKANFGGIAAPVPAGEGEIVLEYDNWRQSLFFLSRYLQLAFGLIGAAWLVRRRAVLLD